MLDKSQPLKLFQNKIQHLKYYFFKYIQKYIFENMRCMLTIQQRPITNELISLCSDYQRECHYPCFLFRFTILKVNLRSLHFTKSKRLFHPSARSLATSTSLK